MTGGAAPTLLPDDEVIDLLEFGIPAGWQKAMILQDFDPLQHTIPEFISFCERLEQVELHESSAVIPNAKKSSEKAGGSKKRKNANTGNEKNPSSITKDCMLHGENCGHSTNECRTLKAQAKKMKENWEAQAPDKKRAFKKKQELHALISEQVEVAMKRNKRKRIEEKKAEELKQFENLSIHDTDEESVISVESGNSIKC